MKEKFELILEEVNFDENSNVRIKGQKSPETRKKRRIGLIIALLLLLIGVAILLMVLFIKPMLEVTFDANGGKIGDTKSTEVIKVKPDSLIEAPASTTREGYTFLGYSKSKDSDVFWNFETDTVKEKTTLYAKWSANTYNISFDVNGGECADTTPRTVTYDSKYGDLPVPTRLGYNFVGWTINDEVVTKDSLVLTANDHTLVAKWDILKFVVTFNTNGGNIKTPTATVAYNNLLEPPTAPTFLGYEFLGWFVDEALETAWNFETDTVTENITLYAKWDTIYTYTEDNDLITITGYKEGITPFKYLEIPSNIFGKEVVAIGENAFIDDQMLTSLVLPSSVKTIEAGCFALCSNLQKATLGKVEYIDSGAFNKAGLTEITIPNTVTTLGQAVFGYCENLTDVSFEEGCQITTLDAATFIASSITNLTIPSSVQTLGPSLLKDCAALEELYIPSSVTSIAIGLLDGCTNLKTLTIPFIGADKETSASTLFNFFFYDNKPTTLENITILGGVICNGAFSGWSTIKNVVIGSGVTSIGEGAFANISIASVTFEADSQLTSIGDGAFYNTNISSIVLPNSVTTIGISAFQNCSALENVTFEATSQLTTIGNFAFNSTNISSITIPDNVTIIGNDAFRYCSNLKSADIGNGITRLPDGIFANCTSLANVTLNDKLVWIGGGNFYRTAITEITIPASVEHIDGMAFAECSLLEKVTFEEGSNLTSIYSSVFAYTAINEISLPNSLEEISSNLFEGCDNLVSISIPYIGYKKTNCYKFSNLFGTYTPTALKNVTILGGEIVNSAFEGFDTIENIVIGSNVTSIGNGAFYRCFALSNVTFEENSNLTTIGNGAFVATNIVNITIPRSVQTIGFQAFAGCTSLDSVIFEESSNLTTIDYEAFYDSTLREIVIPSNVTTIGKGVFIGCSNLENVTVPFIGETIENSSTEMFNYFFTAETNNSTVVRPNALKNVTILRGEIAPMALSNWTTIETITIGNEITSIGSGAFAGNTALTSIIFEEGSNLTAISKNAFASSNISAIKIPKNVTTIDEGAFAGCTNLTSVIFEEGSNLTAIGKNAFVSSNISAIKIPKSVTTIEENAFTNCINLTTLTFEEGSKLTTINANTFAGSNITELTIPKSIETIGSSAFSSCVNLTTLIFEEDSNLKVIDFAAFATTGITEVIIPSSVTTINSSAFAGCVSLEKITLGRSITFLGQNFLTGTKVTEVIIPNNPGLKLDKYIFNDADMIVFCEASEFDLANWHADCFDEANGSINKTVYYYGIDWEYDENNVPTLK